jgi:hypothetical protein
MQSQATRRRISPVAIVVVPLVAALAITLFAWPSSHQSPRHVPVGVAGPASATQQLDRKLGSHAGAFEVHRYADEASARQAIEDRDVYGAFVVTPSGLELLTASAGSSTIAQVLTKAAGPDVPVTDVVPAPAAASGLSSAVFPLILTGSLLAALAGFLATDGRRRAALIVGGSVLAGAVATALVQSWLGVVDGDWAANAAVLSLTIAAIAAFVGGMQTLFGHVGGAIGGALMILVGNPFSGVGSGPEMLPPPAGLIGQLMPPGAGGNLLRSTGFFDGAGAGGHLAVLAAWAGAGLVAMVAVKPAARLLRRARSASARVAMRSRASRTLFAGGTRRS